MQKIHSISGSRSRGGPIGQRVSAPEHRRFRRLEFLPDILLFYYYCGQDII